MLFNSSGSERYKSRFDTLRLSLRRLLHLYVENAKLTVAEKLTLLLSAAVVFVIATICVTFALAFAGVALLETFELVMSPIAASAIIAGVFILLALLVFLLRKPLIINPMARYLSRMLMDVGHHDVSDDKDA